MTQLNYSYAQRLFNHCYDIKHAYLTVLHCNLDINKYMGVLAKYITAIAINFVVVIMWI